MGPSVTLQDVRRAQSSIAHLVLKTPMLPARSLGDLAGCELLLKAENLQRAGFLQSPGCCQQDCCLEPRARRPRA